MLGEGARTDADAAAYTEAYAHAIERVAGAAAGKGPLDGHGISVKLSALHPRYEPSQRVRVERDLYPRLLRLTEMAAKADIGLTIDAEEADRLELSLSLFERLSAEEGLRSWQGLGLAVQAYGRRASAVLDWLDDLGAAHGRRIMVRLVKGAYWDSEIKLAQEAGMPSFPVFTRKAATDTSYLVGAAKLLGCPHTLYPQFATHNAHTLSAILQIAGKRRDFEFQRLHGMGELLYDVATQAIETLPPVRVYAPVGGHKDLLAYLVRRLLENGANSSFVNRFLDRDVPALALAADPGKTLQDFKTVRSPLLREPPALFEPERPNSKGIDLADAATLDTVEEAARAERERTRLWTGPDFAGGEPLESVNPADLNDRLGTAPCPGPDAIDAAFEAASGAQGAWDALGGGTRGEILAKTANRLEDQAVSLAALIAREAGRTLNDGLLEVREAVDFCRYYGARAAAEFDGGHPLPGPVGESNALSLHGRGVFVTIAPWNFPLAIFAGQVTAALAAGNAVLAKPAEQTPFVAAEAVRILHEAGVPRAVLHLMPGRGETVGQALVNHPQTAGVAFTGSTATAQAINRAMAAREGPIAPFIAETGGQNAMVVDSTALPEQVTDDVLLSAFGSAGQRCSSLRILLVQEDVADTVVTMIAGAMRELRLGDPGRRETDIGPIIDAEALQALRDHIAGFEAEGRVLAASPVPPDLPPGHFLPPHLLALERIEDLPGEVFGPVLHVLRYRSQDLETHLAALRATGFGLTLGIHSRIDASVAEILAAAPVGNSYVNRTMIGAVVGSQPFGGLGRSGTGPKAGGPYYLHRFADERVRTENLAAAGGNAALLAMADRPKPA
jgi:RHH-type proline utilization regulon transcriptional repressor/proline dehydrogenase/delta 1-pyrroline-5-carboxylate dehydrogenase